MAVRAPDDGAIIGRGYQSAGLWLQIVTPSGLGCAWRIRPTARRYTVATLAGAWSRLTRSRSAAMLEAARPERDLALSEKTRGGTGVR